MRNRACLCLSLLLTLSTFACSSNNDGSNDPTNKSNDAPKNDATQGEPFSFTVDPTITPSMPAIVGGEDGARPLAAFKDGDGVVSQFVTNEILILEPTDADLAGLVTRYAATVGFDSSKVEELKTQPRRVALRIDKPIDSLDGFIADAPAIGGHGHYTFGSDAGAKLIATVAHEAKAGLKVAPSFVAQPAEPKTFMRKTEEGPLGGSKYRDGFAIGSLKGSFGGQVVGAWQLMEWLGYKPASISVAIIDGGFYVDPTGHPIDTGSGTDLPNDFVQRTFAVMKGPADRVGGQNRATCTNGSPCPWHGNGSAGTATGLMNNRKGSVGTGGQVAKPILLDSGMDDLTVMAATGYADSVGAQVINMSFGGSCNGICRAGRELIGYKQMIEAVASRRVVVASAGNDNVDVNEEHIWPCRLDNVICVGAHDSAGNGYSYSNYGTGIAVFAPTDIPVMPDGVSDMPVHNGTSASAPVVSGVAAMILARNPALTPGDVKNLLISTAVPSATAPKVNQSAGRLDARAAVTQAAPLPTDAKEPNNLFNQASTLTDGEVKDLMLTSKSDQDFFRFTTNDFGYIVLEVDNAWEGFGRLAPFPVAEAGIFGSGGITSQDITPNGSHVSAFVTPGTFRFVVQGLPQPYNVRLEIHETGLLPDAYEDNNTLATATPMSKTDGFRRANIHNATDVDYYAINTSAIAADTNLFWSISSQDQPIKLELLDTNGTVIETRSGTSPYVVFDSNRQYNAYVMRVSSDATDPRGRYTFDYVRYKKPSVVPPQVTIQLPWLDAGDPSPWNGLVDKVDLWVGYTAAASPVGLPPAKTITFAGNGSLHAELVDAKGKVVSGGASVASPGGANGAESLDLASTVTGNDYFVHVTRTMDASAITDPQAPLPALPFSVTFTP